MINHKTIREAVRKRIISSTGIDPLTQFQAENHIIAPAGRKMWIAEYCLGGTEQMLSNRRSRIPSFLVQYDLHVPINTGADAADKTVNDILSEFDLTDPEKSSVAAGSCDIIVKTVKRDVSYGKEWRCASILITLDVCSG